MERIDADQVEARLGGGDAREGEALSHDLQRQPSPRQRAGSGVGDLAFAHIGVDVADRDLEAAGLGCAPGAFDPHPIWAGLAHRDLGEVRDHIGLVVAGGVMDLVEELLLAGRQRDLAARARHLGDDNAAVLARPHRSESRGVPDPQHPCSRDRRSSRP